MLNESNIPLEEDGIEEEILVDEEVAITKAMWGDVGGNIENQTDLQNALDAKQDNLTEAQLNAVNSGITNEKVTTYDGYADQIASKADQSALNAESVARGEADTALGTRIDNEALARQSADNGLQSQIDAITSKSDVVDVVANYAALQAYDTSTLGNNDVVKVLDDETHEDALTYYRWSTTTQTWTYIGQEAPYYSKGQMDVKLAEKQDKLTAGANIQIQNGTISATDTKYTNGNGLNLNGTEFSADTDVLATKEDLEGYYTKTETDTKLAPKLEAEVVAELPTTGAEGKLYLTPKAHTTSTATGNPIEATITAQAGQLESFQLDGDTFQQTYSGKNLYNIEAIPYIWRRAYSSTGEELSWTGYVGTDAYQPVEPNTAYALWNNKIGNTTYLCEYDENKNFIQRSIAVLQFTTTATTKYLRWSLSVGDGEIPPTQTQLELGSKTSFEPYVGGQPSPSPSYPQPIRTVTGEQTVTVVGKNLFRAKDGQYRDNTLTVDVENGVIHVYGHQHASYDQNVWIPVEDIRADGTYTLTMNYSGFGGGAFRLTKDKSYQAANNFGGTYYAPNRGTPVTASATDITYNWILIYLGHGDTQNEVDYYINPQFESGSSSTDFTPYSHQTLPLDLGNIELCKIGTYQDYIYKDGEDWKVHKATANITFNGSESGLRAIQMVNNYRYYLDISNIVSPQDSTRDTIGLCSHFSKTTPGGQWNSPAGSQSFIINNSANPNSSIGFTVGDSTNKLAEFKTWLAENTPTVLYALYTPTDTTITDTTLIAQLEAIRTAALQNGANTITNTATGTNLAGDMEVGYYGYNPTNRYDKFIWLDLNNNYEQIGS